MPEGQLVYVTPVGGGPLDPGFGRPPPSGGHPDNGLPPIGSNYPDNGLPPQPPGVFPPLTPSHPIQPAPPGTPPGSIWPPIWTGGRPDRPDQGLPSPGHPSGQPIPGQPARPDAGLPVPPASTKPPSDVFYVVAGIPGVGWRYVAVDPSLVAGHPLPPAPEPK